MRLAYSSADEHVLLPVLALMSHRGRHEDTQRQRARQRGPGRREGSGSNGGGEGEEEAGGNLGPIAVMPHRMI